jgi:excisionase family DNA binding protein
VTGVTVDPILTPNEVADLLRMRKSWVYNAARTGELPHLRLGRSVRFRRSAIDAYLAGIESGGELSVARASARVRVG